MLNEFRQDPVSGDWVLFATQRAKKPDAARAKFYQTKEECPFDGQNLVNQGQPIATYPGGTIVINNKFPMVEQGMCSPVHAVGLFNASDGKGFHELVITTDHERSFADFTDIETSEVITAYLDRYKKIAADKCGEYISIFHNHGRLGGASVYHNHSQILSMPMIPSGISRSIQRAQDYFQKNNKGIHQALLEEEIKEAKRIVFENDKFIVVCPFASRMPYEMRLYPKNPNPYFDKLDSVDIPLLASALNISLKKLSKVTDNSDYVFFIHTAPPEKSSPDNNFYYWHIEIQPRLSPVAGLELSTDLFENTVDPDEAAASLRAATV